MKSLIKTGKNSLITLMVSLGLFSQTNSVSAEYSRYPTNAEIAKLRNELKKMEKQYPDRLEDRRTSGEKKARESFVKSWSKVNPTLAPFLGTWSDYEEQLSIYPSRTRNRVCLIWTNANSVKLLVGNLSNGKILSSDREVIFKSGKYLGTAIVENNKASIGVNNPLNNPTPLVSIQQLVSDHQDAAVVLREFKNLGCTNSLPKRR